MNYPILFLDIETRPTNAHLDAKFEEWCSETNYKTREKIQREAIAGSFSPLTGYLWCWAGKVVDRDNREISKTGVCVHGESVEWPAISALLKLIERSRTVVAYNGEAFDVPFVHWRALRHGCRPEDLLFDRSAKPWESKLVDPFRDLPYAWRKQFRKPQGSAGSLSLDNVARFLGVNIPDNARPHEEMWIDDDVEGAFDKCVDDVERLHAVFHRLGYMDPKAPDLWEWK